MRRFRLILLPVMIVIFLTVFTGNATAQKPAKDESLRKGETRATLDPNLFTDARTKRAYQIAKEIPWVLDSIYCYCMCEESPVFKHKSLLSCYVDNHAAM
ncbi:hypothetical protein A45J_0187 [hot springs metagenome]|uniref:Uncharacterized protein n=1 Tax=hot springs metagenome TaxID=433727 RepID=A0A5J4L110_9ZZZZ